jgi:hypothetical protein
MEEETKKDKKEAKKEIELTQIVTQTAPAFKLPDGTIIADLNEYLVWLGNLILETKKAVA